MLARIARAFWNSDNEFDEFQEAVDELMEGASLPFACHLQEGDSPVAVEDLEGVAEAFSGAVLMEMRICDELQAEVSAEGRVTTGDEVDWEDVITGRAMVLLKPRFDVGLKAAKE